MPIPISSITAPGVGLPEQFQPSGALVKLEQARAIVDAVTAEASGPVSVFVAAAHGELVAAATMDGAAPDTRLNAQRKAYTAARSDAVSTRALAEKVGAKPPAVLARFVPFFIFLLGRVAAIDLVRMVYMVGDIR